MEATHLHIRHPLPSRLVPHPASHPDSWTTQLRWLAGAAVSGFAVPFLGSSVLGLQHDLYLGIYFVTVLGVFSAYAYATGLDLGATVRRQWKLGVVLGIVVGAMLAPVLAAIGALVALMKDCSIEVEKAYLGAYKQGLRALIPDSSPPRVAAGH